MSKSNLKTTHISHYAWLFLFMTYSAVYCALIESRKQSPLTEDQYSEQHHIVPKSEGGSDDASNLVRLSAREHYIAHLLLVKIYNDAPMLRALTMMQCKSNSHQRDFKFNARLYEKLRLKFSESISGENHWFYGKHHSEETKNKMSESHRGDKNAMKRIEARQKLSASVSGEKNHNYGKFWWTNGKTCIIAKECPDNDYIKGRLKGNKAWNSGNSGIYSEKTLDKLRISSKLCALNWRNRQRLLYIFHIYVCCI